MTNIDKSIEIVKEWLVMFKQMANLITVEHLENTLMLLQAVKEDKDVEIHTDLLSTLITHFEGHRNKIKEVLESPEPCSPEDRKYQDEILNRSARQVSELLLTLKGLKKTNATTK